MTWDGQSVQGGGGGGDRKKREKKDTKMSCYLLAILYVTRKKLQYVGLMMQSLCLIVRVYIELQAHFL